MQATLPVPTRRPEVNHNITAQIESAVRRQLSGRVRDFSVDVHDQGIVLRGVTRSYYVKQLAQHTSLTASNLPLLANNIQVL